VRLLWPLLALVVVGCGSTDTTEPPAELVAVETVVEVRRLWTARVGSGFDRLRLQLRPASDGVYLFAAAHDGQVSALDLESGRRQWNVRTNLPLSAGPAYGEGVLALGSTDGHLILLDAQTGEERWRRAVGSEVIAPPAIAGNAVLLRTVDGRLRSFSLDSGTTNWAVEQSTPILSLRGNAPPRVAGNRVVAGFANGRVGAYSLTNGDTIWEIAVATPSGRTELERLVDVGAALQVVGSDVFAVAYNGRALALDLDTGQGIWQQQLSSFAGLGADWNNVYVTDDVGTVHALDQRNGAVQWQQEALRLRDVTAPARFRDALLVGDFDGWVHVLDPADGRFLARVRAGSGRITDAPLVVGDRFFVQTEDARLAAFEFVVEEVVAENDD
jgi:outer membrane protein assembly factor BamB